MGPWGSTYNYLAPVYHKVIDAWRNNEHQTAREFQLESVQLVMILNAVSPLSAGKSLMRRVGFDFGLVRPPLRQLSEDGQASFDEAVDKLGVFDRTL
ncbi:MAG: N-acetylneuraminate lyase [Verrucomicrobia subdivision 3 bacterium]|nr:N-acetylneuraminate lyase [Limisphaerales bacterium]MCS1416372.1 N-acetylneuraminate lyase [Limisphaerales bacterium]